MPVSDKGSQGRKWLHNNCPATAAAVGTYPAVSTGVGAGVEAGTAGTGAAGTTGALGTTGLQSSTLLFARRASLQPIPQKCKKKNIKDLWTESKWIQI